MKILRTFALLTSLAAYSATSAGEVLIGYVESVEPGFFLSTMQPMIEAVQKACPEDSVRVVQLSATTPQSDLLRYQPDLLIAPASMTVTLMDKHGLHPIATRKSNLAKNPSRSVGAAVVVRSERPDLITLQDLKGKRIAATMPNSVAGWLALCNEFDRTPASAQNGFRNAFGRRAERQSGLDRSARSRQRVGRQTPQRARSPLGQAFFHGRRSSERPQYFHRISAGRLRLRSGFDKPCQGARRRVFSIHPNHGTH